MIFNYPGTIPSSIESMDDIAVVATQPFRINNEDTFGVTPFGVYCFECNEPVGKAGRKVSSNTLQMHMRRRDHRLVPNVKFVRLATILDNCIQSRYGSITDPSPWISETKSIRQCTCGATFSSNANVSRHKKSKQKKNPYEVHDVRKKELFITSCKRTVDHAIINKITHQQTIRVVQPSPSLSSTSFSLSQSSQSTMQASQSSTQTNGSVEYVPIQLPHKGWISIKLAHIKNLFLHLKRLDENLEPYLSMLKLLKIDAGENDVLQQLKDDVTTIYEETDDATLTFFLGCTDEWIKVFCREHVNHLDGSMRSKLQNFFDGSILINSGYNLNFNMRENESVIQKEMRIIVTLSWKFYQAGEINDQLKEALQPILELMEEFKEKHNGKVTESAVEDMIQGLVIQRYIHLIFVEEKSCAFTLLLGQRIVAVRLFYLKKSTNPDTPTEKVLCMRPCGEYGSTLALHIHCYRLASASLLTCTMSKSWDGILEQVNSSILCHIISPLIRNCKNMHSQKLQIRIKEIGDNGDITIDDYSFPRCLWSKLVMKVNEGLERCLGDIFADNEWRKFIDVSTAVNVHRISDENTATREDLLHYDFFVNQNGRVTSENDIVFKDGILPEVFEKLTAFIMICLHGLGLGSTRIAELIRIQMHQVYWKKNCFYYKTNSIKKPSITAPNSNSVVHKLPASTSRFLLLYDYVGRKFCSSRELFLYDISHHPMNRDYENRQVHSVFAKMFDLRSNCTCLVMRHLYTSICNYLFPGSNNNFDESIVSTVSEVAEMSGHSSETHNRHYSSLINREYFFDKYHRNLGSEIANDDENREPMNEASEDDALCCLKSVKGVAATFLSDLQKDVVLDACNNLFKHSFCSLGCGGGKSMTWTLSTLRFQLNGHQPKTSLVVIPYCFLLDHHVSSMKGIVGQCSRISIGALKGSEIHDNVLPELLRDKDRLPAILFLSLEGMAALVKHQFGHLELLASEGYLYKIYVDECHTVLNEFNFREKYLALQQLSALNVPMMVLSGSFQKAFIPQYLNFMFGQSDESQFNLYCDDNVVGNPCIALRHVPSSTYVDECCDYIRERLRLLCEYNVHVIVSTLDEGKSFWHGF